MHTHVVINGKEITDPLVKVLLLIVAVTFSFVITMLFLFVFLPLLGLAVTLSLGLIGAVFFAVFISIPALIFLVALFGRLLGEVEFRIRR